MTITDGRPNLLDPPVRHFGGDFTGDDADGWRVVLRGDDGELESIAGPFRAWGDAMAALARILKGA